MSDCAAYRWNNGWSNSELCSPNAGILATQSASTSYTDSATAVGHSWEWGELEDTSYVIDTNLFLASGSYHDPAATNYYIGLVRELSSLRFEVSWFLSEQRKEATRTYIRSLYQQSSAAGFGTTTVSSPLPLDFIAGHFKFLGRPIIFIKCEMKVEYGRVLTESVRTLLRKLRLIEIKGNRSSSRARIKSILLRRMRRSHMKTPTLDIQKPREKTAPETVFKIRQLLKLTQEEFAQLVGVSLRTVARWESKQAYADNVSEKQLKNLSRIIREITPNNNDASQIKITDWLKRPQEELHGHAPVDLLASDYATDILIEAIKSWGSRA